jgi:hypothetical protein
MCRNTNLMKSLITTATVYNLDHGFVMTLGSKC